MEVRTIGRAAFGAVACLVGMALPCLASAASARRRSGGFLALRRLPLDPGGAKQDRPVIGRCVRPNQWLDPWLHLFHRTEERAPDLGRSDARQVPAESQRARPWHEDVRHRARCRRAATHRRLPQITAVAGRPEQVTDCIHQGAPDDKPAGERRHTCRRCRSHHAAAMGIARPDGFHRHEIRLRHRRLRRLHGPHERRGRAVLHHRDR